AWLQIQEHCRDGSVLNYAQRLPRQKDLFEVNLRCLVERVITLNSGLNENYEINIPLDPPSKGNILDALAVWLSKAQNELSKYKRSQRIAIYSIWSDSSLSVTPRAVGTEWDTFDVDLVVGQNVVPGTKTLLRGVAFEYFGNQQRPILLKVSPP